MLKFLRKQRVAVGHGSGSGGLFNGRDDGGGLLPFCAAGKEEVWSAGTF